MTPAQQEDARRDFLALTRLLLESADLPESDLPPFAEGVRAILDNADHAVCLRTGAALFGSLLLTFSDVLARVNGEPQEEMLRKLLEQFTAAGIRDMPGC